VTDTSATPVAASAADLLGGDAAVELSSNRTSLSFERTRMSADRTLMSIVRTALSLIGFGFTIYQVFHRAQEAHLLPLGERAPRNFGLALVLLGVLLLAMGIISHAGFGVKLNQRRARLFSLALVRRDIHYRTTPTFVTALLLLLIGVAAAAGIVFRQGFFG
jgi:putative membrane protein